MLLGCCCWTSVAAFGGTSSGVEGDTTTATVASDATHEETGVAPHGGFGFTGDNVEAGDCREPTVAAAGAPAAVTGSAKLPN